MKQDIQNNSLTKPGNTFSQKEIYGVEVTKNKQKSMLPQWWFYTGIFSGTERSNVWEKVYSLVSNYPVSAHIWDICDLS